MTGLTSDQVDRLVLDVYAHADLDPARRRAVGPYRTVLMVLLYLRQNLPQALLAELFGCSQPTVSRLITRLTPVITTVLTPNAEQVAARDLRSTVRIDGFVAPTGDRRKDTYTSGMYSGKRHRCGFNIQVVGSFHGRLVLTGTPQPGAMHDAKAWRESRLAATFEGRLHADGGPGGFGDTAYTGTGLCVPHRRTKGQVYRNFADDAGIDFVTDRPGRPPNVFDLVLDGGTSPMTWDELLAAARLPDDRLTWPQRFILILPLLEEQELPADATDVMNRALEGIGATNGQALAAAILKTPRLVQVD